MLLFETKLEGVLNSVCGSSPQTARSTASSHGITINYYVDVWREINLDELVVHTTCTLELIDKYMWYHSR